MLLSVLLSGGIAILTIAMAYLGVHVTLHPPNESSTARRNYKVGFILCAFASVVLVTWQGIRNGLTESSLEARLNIIQRNTENPPKVEVKIPPISVPAPLIIREEAKSATAQQIGNLRDRTADLSKKITDFLRFRDSALDGLYDQQKAGSNRWDLYGPWETSTAGGFKATLLPSVVAIRNECAGLHFEDTRLDQDLQQILTSQQSASQHPENKGADQYIPNPDEIKEISERLAILSTEVN